MEPQQSFSDLQKQNQTPVSTMKDAPWLLISVATWFFSAFFFFSWQKDIQLSDTMENVINVLIISTFIAIIWAFAWLIVIRVFKDIIVKISLVLWPSMLVALGVWTMSEGGDGTFYFIWAALTLVWYWSQRAKIPFVTAILSSASAAVTEMKSLILVQSILVIVNIGWGIFFVFFTIFGWVNMIEGANANGQDYINLMWIAILMYTMCTALNTFTAHVICCGAIASWWLTPESNNNISASAARTCRYSYGSISLGAFIITIVEAIRIFIGTWMNNPCLRCCWRCFEKFVELYSSYVFVRVAVFNEEFCTAAKQTNALFVKSGFTALANDTFVYAVLNVGGYCMGAIHGLVTVLLFDQMAEPCFESSTCLYGIWIVGLWIGKNMTIACIMPIDSAIRTTYVLWSEEGMDQVMKQTRPDFFNPIEESFKLTKHYEKVQQARMGIGQAALNNATAPAAGATV